MPLDKLIHVYLLRARQPGSDAHAFNPSAWQVDLGGSL